MSIWTNIIDRLGIARKSEIKQLTRWQLDTADAQQWTVPDPYIFANQADMYRLDPNLGTVLDMFAEDIGMTTFNVKRRKGEELQDIPNHEFEMLLESPNPIDTGVELLAQTVTDYKLNGNAVWWLNRKSWSAKPDEIWYIPFNQIQPVPDGRMYLSYYKYFPGEAKEPIPLPVWQIVHFKTRNPFNRYVGLSPIESLADTLAGDIGMRRTQRQTYVGNQGEPPSILGFKDFVSDDAWSEIQKKVKESSEKNKMMLLRGTGDAVSWMSRALSNREQDLVALYNQNRQDIWNRMVPGALAMLDSNANRSTADAARATYSESLWRMMQVLAKKITKEILYTYTWNNKLVGEFDDPRFVDRQLEIAEIQEFAKYHTLEEIRKEKYTNEPLGDERDNLLPAQINAQTGDGTKEPTPTQLQPYTGQNMTQPPEYQTMDSTAQTDNATPNDTPNANKAQITALYAWKRIIAGGKTEKAKSFHNSAIPEMKQRAIKAMLENTPQAEMVAYMERMIDGLKPQPKVDGQLLVKSLYELLKEKG